MLPLPRGLAEELRGHGSSGSVISMGPSDGIKDDDKERGHGSEGKGKDKPIQSTPPFALGQAGVDEHERAPADDEFVAFWIHLHISR